MKFGDVNTQYCCADSYNA